MILQSVGGMKQKNRVVFKKDNLYTEPEQN